MLALGYGSRWRWAWEHYRRDIDSEPRRGSYSSHAGKGAGNADKLGGIWIGDRLVRPSFWDRPAPGEHGLPIREAD